MLILLNLLNLAKCRETCEAPRFHITDIARSNPKEGPRAYLRWRMSGRIRGWPHTSLVLQNLPVVSRLPTEYDIAIAKGVNSRMK